MKNCVTVTVSIPWLENMATDAYKELYSILFKMSQDNSSISHQEARYMVAAMSIKQAVYSYEILPAEMDFSAYTNISKYVPGKHVDVQLSKIGDHIQTGPKDDIKYYNFMSASFDNGQMTSQTIGHMEPDEGAEVEDQLVLSDQQMKLKFTALKGVAVKQASRNVIKTPVINTGIPSVIKETPAFSL